MNMSVHACLDIPLQQSSQLEAFPFQPPSLPPCVYECIYKYICVHQRLCAYKHKHIHIHTCIHAPCHSEDSPKKRKQKGEKNRVREKNHYTHTPHTHTHTHTHLGVELLAPIFHILARGDLCRKLFPGRRQLLPRLGHRLLRHRTRTPPKGLQLGIALLPLGLRCRCLLQQLRPKLALKR